MVAFFDLPVFRQARKKSLFLRPRVSRLFPLPPIPETELLLKPHIRKMVGFRRLGDLLLRSGGILHSDRHVLRFLGQRDSLNQHVVRNLA